MGHGWPHGHWPRQNSMTLPHVTWVLKAAGLVDDRWFSQESAWRGSCVHLACQYDDQGDLDEASLDPVTVGYLKAWRKCKKEMCLQFNGIEVSKQDSLYGYCGRIDRILGGAVLDLKTGGSHPAHRLQLAAYARLVAPMCRRIIVRIKVDGTYQAREFPMAELERDFQTFTAALAVANFRKEHKLL